MKKIFVLAALLAFVQIICAQSVDLRRKIEVSGTAEQEVTPDIINVSISLKEYMDGRTKITIENLEAQLKKAVTDAGIAKEDFMINNLFGYKNYYERKKDEDFLASKQYRIRLQDLDKYNQILAGLDPKGIESTNIDSYDYSKMTDVKRELKIQALLAAKEKATYLLASINEKLGGVISISEPDNNNNIFQYQNPYANTVMAYNKASTDESSDINFKKIKLSFQIDAVFEIAK
jgi:uncharacterized protein YggE